MHAISYQDALLLQLLPAWILLSHCYIHSTVDRAAASEVMRITASEEA